ncbi:MAG: PDZ domain-containing protein [Gemmatimonadetes bacterium]|nr:PDZ domain-containing protein [Gemmatimonadota bacterium]
MRLFGGDETSSCTVRDRDGAANLMSLHWGPTHGLELMEMKPGLESYFGTAEGVLVTDVDEDSTLGLEAGDVILKIGDRSATDAARVNRILGSYSDGEEITLTIMRQGREMNVAGRQSN